MSDAAKEFYDRERHWFDQGLRGRDLFNRLATDDALPRMFAPDEAAAIASLTISAMAQRRQRGMPPSYLSLSRRHVRYPRHELCMWLADMMVERRV